MCWATPPRLNGYDISTNEINLFVLTPDRNHSFRRIKRVLENRGMMQGVQRRPGW